jgi:anti-sigma B factor antagonist
LVDLALTLRASRSNIGDNNLSNQAEFITSKIDGVSVVAIHGEVDIANVDELKMCIEKAAEDAGPGFVIDLTKASYFDSRTIALLAELATKTREHEQRVALLAPADGFAARILQIAGLPNIVPAFQSIADALNSVKQPTGA